MRPLILLLAFAAPAAASLRAGAASADITPAPGTPMPGYYYNRGSDGVHDPLHAKAIVLEYQGVKAALVSCDIISMPAAFTAAARARIERETGIPGAHVMISATHTHTGALPMAGPTRYTLEGESLALAQRYAALVPERIAEAVARANAALRPARVRTATGQEPTLTFNRRFLMTDGTIGWNPGKRNPRIVRPSGPIDPEVPVVWLEDEKGAPIAAHVNYALHLDTVGGTQVSADYPYTLARTLGDVFGPGLETLFTIGAAGNLNHIDVSTARPQKGHGEAARIGSVLAGAVLKALWTAEPAAGATLQTASTRVALRVRESTAADLEWARTTAATFGRKDAAPFIDLVRAFRISDTAARAGRPYETEVQVITLGSDVAWVALPGEIFTELGLAIKLASPFRHTVIVSLANEALGYVPHRKAYAEGAYEVVSARVAEGSGEKLADEAIALLLKLHATAGERIAAKEKEDRR
jgi:neutral ceramidase